MMALIVAAVATFGMTGMIVVYARFRPIGTPHSWGEAMLGATFVFFLLFVAYGILPHQWLTFADKDLLWRSDKFFEPWLGLTGARGLIPIKGFGQVLLPKAAVKDVIAVTIYVFAGVTHGKMWGFWQKRGTKKKTVATSSEFGRPLVRPEL